MHRRILTSTSFTLACGLSAKFAVRNGLWPAAIGTVTGSVFLIMTMQCSSLRELALTPH